MNLSRKSSQSHGKLFVVATPIGNLEDITLRAIRVLKEVDVILCEDTRVTQKLSSVYNITTKHMHYDDHSSPKCMDRIIQKLQSGMSIALVSDAGTPLLSDPGASLVKRVIDEGLDVEAIPGPCSIINALVLSGLSSTHFTFLGFLARQESAKRKALSSHIGSGLNIVFFESPHRLCNTLQVLCDLYPSSQMCIAREMTKRFEEISRGSPSSLLEHYLSKSEIKGEIVVVVENQSAPKVDTKSAEQALASLIIENGVNLKEAVAEISASYNLPKNLIYKMALALKA